ncbi:MAG: putative transporter ATP-binding protein [Frankiales bacterium]|nr:putative transporter ATP-binding protein [Frankiales bacterium]
MPCESAGMALVVDARGLTKRYGSVLAVDDLDLVIEAGEVVALLGPNGAGKSTTVDLLLGLNRPDSGTVALFGGSPAVATRSGRVGATLQAGGLIDKLTVRELIDVLGSFSPHPLGTEEVLQRAGISNIGSRMTDKLSGGQGQRVRFAMAIAGDPDLLVLDEPTVAMDVTARRAFWSTMRTWTDAGRTVLFATHYLEEADAYADRVILMARGRVVADGPTAEVKAAVGGRVIRASWPAPGAQADRRLRALPGVTSVELRGDVVTLHCADSDAALRGLLALSPKIRNVEVSGAALEEAFLTLTSDDVAAP